MNNKEMKESAVSGRKKEEKQTKKLKEKKPKEPKKRKAKDETKTSMVALLNPMYLQYRIDDFGLEPFSMLKYLRFILLCVIGLLGMCFVVKLKAIYTLVLILLELFLLPSVYYISWKNKYEMKKFVDVSAYLEQMLYSFKRKPKVLSALKDSTILFEGEDDKRFRDAINRAIEHIQYGETAGDVYQEAFQFIENEHGCKRVSKIHSFLTRVENAGGDPEDAINILLEDRSLWVSRIQNLLQEKAKIRLNVTIGIALSLVVVTMCVYMLPPEFQIYSQMASQLARTITIGLDMLIWYYVQYALGQSLLDVDKDIPFEEIERSYNIVMHDKGSSKNKSFTLTALICLLGAVISFLTLGTAPAVALALFALIFFTQPKRQYKACFKRVKREVEKAFPDWLLSLALQMQTDNLHVSIIKTSLDAPRILMEELQKLQDGIEVHPDELEPFANFFKKLEIADIMTAMKMLYAMDQFGAADSQEQIKALVNRNTEIMDKAERMRLEDHLAGISFAMLLPMLTGVISMLTDLVLVMGFVLSKVNF